MKKFFIAVISLAIFAIAAYGIAYLVIPVTSVELEEYTHSVDFICEDAFIVRDETVYYSTSDGIVYNIVTDGDRVSQNSSISTTYNGNADNEVLQKLRTIDLKINRLKKEDTDSTLYRTAASSAENEIALYLENVLTLAEKNSVESIHDIKVDINNLRSGEEITPGEKINKLYIERNNVESEMAVSKTDTIADRAGIFSSYVDGLESVLTPERIKEYTPEYIKSLNLQDSEYMNGKSVVTGDPICKVMDNHSWYVMGIADKDSIGLLETGKTVTIKFLNLSGSSVKGEVIYISEPDANGESIYLIKVQTYLESAFSYRNIDAQIILKEHSGYKVPTDSIHTGHSINEYYVYARKGSEAYRCDIDILYSDSKEGYSIIASSEGAENNLGSMERLVVGER